MKFKKLAMIVCAVILCTFSFLACGKVSAGTNPTGTNQTEPGSTDPKITEPNPTNNDDDNKPYTDDDQKKVVSVNLAKDVYFQTLYAIGEPYNSDIKITEVYNDNTFGDIITVDISMIENFPADDFAGAKEITVFHDNFPPIIIKLYFADLDSLNADTEVSLFQKNLLFNDLTLKYTHVDDDGNMYFREQVAKNYKYKINGSLYSKDDDFSGTGLFTNISIIDESGKILKNSFDIILGEITETVKVNIYDNTSECGALFYLFVYQVYSNKTDILMPVKDEDIWQRIKEWQITDDLGQLSIYDKTFENLWPSGGSYAFDFNWQNFKKAVAYAYKLKLQATTELTEIEVYFIDNLIIYNLGNNEFIQFA